MAFAILQKELVVPDVARLKRAFSVSPYLRDIDAENAAHDAHGILLRGLDREHADALFAALLAEGVEIELVKESTLPSLQHGKITKRLSLARDHFTAYDAMDRPATVAWADIAFLAVGYVRTGAQKKHRSAKEEAQLRAASAAPLDEAHVLKHGEQEQYHLLLEIFLRGGATHHSIVADEFLFDCLGEKAGSDLALNFVALIQEVAARAPHAGLNRGAMKVLRETPELLAYPSRAAFNEEIVWMLWRIARLTSGA